MTTTATHTNLVTAAGEVVDLDSDAECVAAYEALADLKATVDGQMRTLAEAVAVRADRDNIRSLRVGDLAVSINAPTREVIDGDKLADALADLAERGILSPRAVEAACPATTVFKPAKRELSKLRGLDLDEVTAAIDSAIEREPVPSRRLTIKAAA